MHHSADQERSSPDLYLRRLALWARMLVWVFVIVPWWVLVVFHPVQDARMLWRVITRPTEAGPTIARWLGESYGHVLPIFPWPRVQPQPNLPRPLPRVRWVARPGTYPSMSLKVSSNLIRCRPTGTRCRSTLIRSTFGNEGR